MQDTIWKEIKNNEKYKDKLCIEQKDTRDINMMIIREEQKKQTIENYNKNSIKKTINAQSSMEMYHKQYKNEYSNIMNYSLLSLKPKLKEENKEIEKDQENDFFAHQSNKNELNNNGHAVFGIYN